MSSTWTSTSRSPARRTTSATGSSSTHTQWPRSRVTAGARAPRARGAGRGRRRAARRGGRARARRRRARRAGRPPRAPGQGVGDLAAGGVGVQAGGEHARPARHGVGAEVGGDPDGAPEQVDPALDAVGGHQRGLVLAPGVEQVAGAGLDDDAEAELLEAPGHGRGGARPGRRRTGRGGGRRG